MSTQTTNSLLPGRSLLSRIWPTFIIMPTIALILSCVITLLNVGLTNDFQARWMRGFVTAIPVMFVAIAIMGRIGKGLKLLLPNLPALLFKVLLSIVTAMILESLLAAALTVLNLSQTDGPFMSLWAKAVVGSLPFGIVVSLIMGFTVKPWLDRRLMG